MTFAIIAFLCVFLMMASAGVMLFHRQAMLGRIQDAVTPQQEKASLSSTLQQTTSSLSALVGKLEQMIPKSDSEVSVVQQRMVRAGYRNENAVKYFYGSKVVTIAVLGVAITVTGLASQNPFVFYIAAAGVGYLGPDFWLGRKIKARQAKLRSSLPDVLDLLVICVEAGLGMDQATARSAQELKTTHPVLAEELDIVVLEQRAGRPRSEAWKRMADRTDVDVVRNLVSILVQAEQFGTSVAKTLRTHSDTLRTQRVQMIEELAAKTTVKLIFPLVLFIFPCLFLVTLGPAAIMMSETFKDFLH